MTDLIGRNLNDIFTMMAIGFGMMLVFRTMESIGNRIASKRWKKFIYLFSWLIASKLFSEGLYSCAHGKLTVHAVIATLVGILLWKKLRWGEGNEEETSEN